MIARPRALLSTVAALASVMSILSCIRHSAGPKAVPSQLDHIIVAIDSLDRGIAFLKEATGIAPVFGGVHPGRGTQNALMSLGAGAYLELLAPNPSDARGPAAVASFAKYRQLTPVSWAARTSNADSLRSALVAQGEADTDVRPGSRRLSDGNTLRWRTLAPWPGARENLLPFFIEWQPGAAHPSADAADGCVLTSMRFTAVNPDSIRRHLAKAAMGVAIDQAAADAIQLELRCGRRTVRLPTS